MGPRAERWKRHISESTKCEILKKKTHHDVYVAYTDYNLIIKYHPCTLSRSWNFKSSMGPRAECRRRHISESTKCEILKKKTHHDVYVAYTDYNLIIKYHPCTLSRSWNFKSSMGPRAECRRRHISESTTCEILKKKNTSRCAHRLRRL